MEKTAAFEAGMLMAMEKHAISVTELGHKYDTELAKMRERHGAEQIALGQKYKGIGSKKQKGSVMRSLRGFGKLPEHDPRHEAYKAKMHAKGVNPLNPFGGMLTPSKYEHGGSALFFGQHKAKGKK